VAVAVDRLQQVEQTRRQLSRHARHEPQVARTLREPREELGEHGAVAVRLLTQPYA
jgi:hypothetical protein